ncbi:MAG: ATP-dependent RecD-like DNA helicase [Clostridia bacterium]|nr:ATP-dependent RecD-like DNA helicase [Clostridia bacterium]
MKKDGSLDTFIGEVIGVIYRNDETGYTVMKIRTTEGLRITVVGTCIPVSEGHQIKAIGVVRNNKTYGDQVVAEDICILPPSKLDGIKKFLSSGLIKGLGPTTAEAIIDVYGLDTLSIMEYPIKLAKVRGISLTKAMNFAREYMNLKKLQDTMMFLQELGISVNMSLRIYNHYFENSIEIVRKNPYKLVDDIEGIGFATADRIGQNLGIEKDSEFRIEAAISYCLKKSANMSGNAFLFENDLYRETLDVLSVNSEDIGEKIRDVLGDMILLGTVIRYETKMGAAIMHKSIYNVEKKIASKLADLRDRARLINIDPTEAISLYEARNKIKLHEKQVEAIEDTFEHGVHIITGGPGTGKTTIIKCIISIFADLGLDVALCAPTGRAAKRMSQATGSDASTIHRLLGYSVDAGGTMRFVYNENRPLPYDVVIVDEVSMLDEPIMYHLISALEDGTRLVLVGDKDQLPSVGIGCVLHDLIESGFFGVSFLTHIYRQAETSGIVVNAHRINNGLMPSLDNKSPDFFYDEKNNSVDIANTVMDLVLNRLPTFLDCTPRDINVLCPMKRGTAGITALNARLQKALNPYSKEKKEFKHGEVIYREGDKVMQIVNDYEMTWFVTHEHYVENGCGVFNGDVGIIEKVNYATNEFTIHFDDDKISNYSFSQADEITLAYAVTIHKSQGSEFDNVVLALDASYLMQTRNLLYTGVTRAKNIVVLVGAIPTIQKMIANNETLKRNSLLTQLLIEEFGNL